MKKKQIKDKALIDSGYMTIDEFMELLTPSLKCYLYDNWHSGSKDLHHPEDLFSNASIYIEVGRHLAGDFLVRPKR